MMFEMFDKTLKNEKKNKSYAAKECMHSPTQASNLILLYKL